jgi:hypothetical protein
MDACGAVKGDDQQLEATTPRQLQNSLDSQHYLHVTWQEAHGPHRVASGASEHKRRLQVAAHVPREGHRRAMVAGVDEGTWPVPRRKTENSTGLLVHSNVLAAIGWPLGSPRSHTWLLLNLCVNSYHVICKLKRCERCRACECVPGDSGEEGRANTCCTLHSTSQSHTHQTPAYPPELLMCRPECPPGFRLQSSPKDCMLPRPTSTPVSRCRRGRRRFCS